MPKISLAILLKKLPELTGISIITNQEQLSNFLGKLRQDYYSPEKLKKFKLDKELSNWLQTGEPSSTTFFAVHDEEDNLAKNDDWGHFELYRCIAVRSANGKIHLFKTLMEKFFH